MMHTPFDRIALDFIESLPRTTWGPPYLLVIMDYATRYQEAVPMRNMKSPSVAWALMHYFAQVELPREILMDRGSPFTVAHLQKVCEMLQIKQIFMATYHPQTDSLVERMNQTLKGSLKKAAYAQPRAWDLYVNPILLTPERNPTSLQWLRPV